MPPAGTAETAASKADVSKAPDESPIAELCVVDLGEHSRKSVKRLRRGRGKLMDKVEDAILSLREEGILSESAQTVVVVVREEQTFGSFLDRDDDDDDDD